MRNAFKEALESYQEALALFNLLPESPERNLRELELRQSVVETLYLTNGYSASETIDATESAAALAEKSGNLKQLVNWLLRRGLIALTTGDFPGAGAALDRALELALREGSPTNLASVYTLQLPTRYWRGDLAGAEEHFTAGLKFFDDLGYWQLLGGAVTAFGYASWVAWTLGRADVAREREIQMMAAASPSNLYAMTVSAHLAAHLRAYMREYEQAEALAASALSLSEKHQFPYIAALSRCALGRVRAQ